MVLAPFPVVLPLIAAALLVLLERVPGQHRLLDLAALSCASGVLAIDLVLLKSSFAGTIVYWFGAWAPMRGFPPGIALVVDPAAAGLAALAALLTLAGLAFSWHYFRAIGTYYHTLMLLFLASMQGFCLTGDLFNMFVFFELMGVSAYALTGYRIEDTGPLEGALNFTVMNSIGGFMVLFGIGLIYGRTGGLNLAWAGEYLALHGVDRAMVVAFVLLAVGFLIKGAVVPFHLWLPDAHAVAPTPASMLFSGIMVELGLYAVARIYWTVFAGTGSLAPLRDLLLCLGLATALLGAVMACLQRHLKRLLAFSTVSHSGMMLAGIALLDGPALGGTLLYLAGHGLVKAGLFVGAGIVLYQFRSVDEELLRGKGRPLRATAFLFFACGLALAGLPPFAACAGKSIVEQAAEAAGYRILPQVFLISSAITGAAVLRAGASIFLGAGTGSFLSRSAPAKGEHEEPETSGPKGRTPLVMLVPFALLLVAALLLGVLPQATPAGMAAAASFVDAHGYRESVLRAGHFVVPPLPPSRETKVGQGAAAALLAIVLAAAFLMPVPKRRGWLAKLVRPVTGAASVLRSVHSGYIGDYVIIFMIGAATIMAVSMLLVEVK